MTEIHRYQKEREKQRADYAVKIRRHRWKIFLRTMIVLLLLTGLIVLGITQYKRRVYTTYEVLSAEKRELVNGTQEVRLDKTILTYSKDGIHCTDSEGKMIWNQTYQIQDVLLDICQDVVVLASYNGREVYVANTEKILGKFTVNLPIRNVAVSATGRVAVVMEDVDAIHYKLYTAEGKELYEGEATMSGSGYPMAMSLSPNGELLQISYIYLDAGVQKNKVVFYNLGDVGANNADYIVSVHEYDDVVIPFVNFMNDQTAYAVGDDRLILYTGGQKPVPLAEYTFDEEIRSVFGNDEYVGLVFYAENATARYMMNVYHVSGEFVGSFFFNIAYSDLLFVEEAFLVYNDAECALITLENEVKYQGNFGKSVRMILPQKSAYKYLLVTVDGLELIQLK